MQALGADALTINEAAATTGWSARMLRYIESIGLLQSRRSGSGYRLYGPEELQRLSTLRELLDAEGLDLGEVGFALRLRREPELREAIERWLEAEPRRPADVSAADWLRFEQEKHQRLLVVAAGGRETGPSNRHAGAGPSRCDPPARPSKRDNRPDIEPPTTTETA